jgi:hypothetical protein
MRVDRQQDARIAVERLGHGCDCQNGRTEGSSQRREEAAFGGLERPPIKRDHTRAARTRVDGGRLKERRLTHTRNAVDDGDERHVALDELEQRCSFSLAPDQRAGALIEPRLQGARPHQLHWRVYRAKLVLTSGRPRHVGGLVHRRRVVSVGRSRTPKSRVVTSATPGFASSAPKIGPLT